MAQADYEIGADEPGLDYRAADNAGKQALLTCHKGTARPAYAEPGTLWIKDPGSGTLWTVYIYDGTLDLVIGYLLITGAADPQFVAAGSSFYVESTTRTGVNFDITSGYGLLGLKPGDRFVVKNDNASPSGAGAGLKIDALSPVPIVKDLLSGAVGAVEAGDIIPYSIFEVVYDGTNFSLLTPPFNNFVAEASQAQQEAATADDVYVSPANQQYHPSASKAWVRFDGTGTVAINAGYNVTSITDHGTGDYSANYTNALSADNQAAFSGMTRASAPGAAVTSVEIADVLNPTQSTFVRFYTKAGSTLVDRDRVSLIVFGDL